MVRHSANHTLLGNLGQSEKLSLIHHPHEPGGLKENLTLCKFFSQFYFVIYLETSIMQIKKKACYNIWLENLFKNSFILFFNYR